MDAKWKVVLIVCTKRKSRPSCSKLGGSVHLARLGAFLQTVRDSIYSHKKAGRLTLCANFPRNSYPSRVHATSFFGCVTARDFDAFDFFINKDTGRRKSVPLEMTPMVSRCRDRLSFFLSCFANGSYSAVTMSLFPPAQAYIQKRERNLFPPLEQRARRAGLQRSHSSAKRSLTVVQYFRDSPKDFQVLAERADRAKSQPDLG